MLADLSKFLGDLLDNWAAFMTGGIPVALLAIWERWRSRNVSFRFYVAVFLGFGFAAASFQTWRHEQSTMNVAEQALLLTKNRAVTKAQLQQFYIEAGQLMGQQLDKSISDEDFKKYSDSVDAWLNKTAGWIENNLGPAATARFLDGSGSMSFTFTGAVNRQHNNIINSMTTFRKNLSILIETNAWDKS
jgi:hypothetical protein